MKKRGTIIILIVLILAILILAGVLACKIFNDQKTNSTNSNIENSQDELGEKEESKSTKEEKEIKIYNGNERPIAVMIDNHTGAWPQAGLNQAYLVYEIVVEGGETRLMALFKGVDLDQIGPVRSSRHYFLDYSMENDAIYVHYGWSPQAQSDISTYKVNNINGITESSSAFWRTKDKSAPHNVFTSTSKILEIAKSKGYSTTSNTASLLKYVADEVELEKGTNANSVIIPHSNMQTVKYLYDEETKLYTRYAREKIQTDYLAKEALTTKNIIIEFIDNYTLQDTENKGRQGLYNIGTYNGYYITNGKAIQIQCTKTSRTSKTIYKTLNGEEIEVNDGNTWIQICPKDAEVVLE